MTHTPETTDDGTVLAWEISPSNDSAFDSAYLPADTEQHHQEALAFARDRLMEIWDNAEEGEEARSVSMQLVRVSREDFEEGTLQ